MQQDFENNQKEHIQSEPDSQETVSQEQVIPLSHENSDRDELENDPAEQVKTQTDEEISTAPRRFNMHNLDKNFTARTNESRAEEWSEPIYSETHEKVSSMYTPGIYVDQQPSRKRSHEPEPERKTQEYDSRGGRLARAICLVLVCVLLSSAASYAVIEFRFSRGDFTVVNQVVLGGGQESRQSNLSTPVSTIGTRMSAEDIYIMACTQVVSITTKIENISIFGGLIPSTTTTEAGSGFIISRDGYILTNYHVVETALMNELPLIVTLNDGTEYTAKVIGYERNNDIALIKIAATGLNPAIIANSDNINVGQTVYAVGNPLGELVYTMTDGIVSARDREVLVDGKIINTFQFSAAVNSGNSGGPLYDVNGEVIGIVTAKPRRASVEGIGFAIPINDALAIAMELIEFGYLTGRPLLGINVQTVTAAHAEHWGWVVGARVSAVSPGSAAEKAGLMIGDIIIGLGDTQINSTESMMINLKKFRAGDTTTLTVWRNGEEIELWITFDEDMAAGQVRSQRTEEPAQERPSSRTTP